LSFRLSLLRNRLSDGLFSGSLLVSGGKGGLSSGDNLGSLSLDASLFQCSFSLNLGLLNRGLSLQSGLLNGGFS
jgi:hypothetical protein